MGLIEKLNDFQIKNYKLVLLLNLLITLAFIPGYFNLLNVVEPSVEKLLPEKEQVVKNINILRNYYDIDAIQLVIKTDEDIKDPNFLKFLDYLKNYLEKEEHISKVQTLSDIVKEDLGYIPNRKQEVKNILEKDPRAAYFKNYDDTLTVVYIYTDVGADTWLTLETLNNIKERLKELKRYYSNFEYWLAGFPALNIDLFLSIIFDFIKISFLAFAVIFLILLIKLRNIKEVFLVLTVIIFPLLWTTGAIGYFHLPLTIVSTVFGAMLMALGISYGTNVYNTYLQEKKRLKDKEKALKKTMSDITLALIGSSFTTIASFIALLSGILPSYKALGIILAIGISFVLIYTILIFPSFIALKEKINIRGEKNEN